MKCFHMGDWNWRICKRCGKAFRIKRYRGLVMILAALIASKLLAENIERFLFYLLKNRIEFSPSYIAKPAKYISFIIMAFFSNAYLPYIEYGDPDVVMPKEQKSHEQNRFIKDEK